MSSEGNDASVELAGLGAKRGDAQAHVDELEVELRAAGVARAEARAALVEAERKGVKAAERMKLERQLSDAEARPGIVAARIEGGRQRVRDADVEVARHVRANLTALVGEEEAEGRAAASDFNEALRAVIEAYERREAVAARIIQLASLAGPLQPGDVSRSRGEQIMRAAADLLRDGGEVAPTLDHDPREPRYGTPVAASAS